MMVHLFLLLFVLSLSFGDVAGQTLVWTDSQIAIPNPNDEPIAVYKRNLGQQREMVLRNASIHVLTADEVELICATESLPSGSLAMGNRVLFLGKTYSQACDGRFGLGVELSYVNKWCGLGVPIIFQVDKYHPGVLINNRPSKDSPQWQDWMRLDDAHCWATRWSLDKLLPELEERAVDIHVTNEAQKIYANPLVQVYFRGVAPAMYFFIVGLSLKHLYARFRVGKLSAIHKAILLLNIFTFSILMVCAADYGLFYVTDRASIIAQLATITAFGGIRSAGDYLLIILYDQNISATFKKSSFRKSNVYIWIGCSILSVLTDCVPLACYIFGMERVSSTSVISGIFVALMQTSCVIMLTWKTIQLTRLFQKYSDTGMTGNNVQASIRILAERLKRCVIVNIICSIFAIVLSGALALTPLVFYHPRNHIISFFLFSTAGIGNAFAQTMACAEPPKSYKRGKVTTTAVLPSNLDSSSEETNIQKAIVGNDN